MRNFQKALQIMFLKMYQYCQVFKIQLHNHLTKTNKTKL